MIGISKDCILFRNGYCFSEDGPEKITGCITECDYYRLNSFKAPYQDGFIDGFEYCNEMKKQPVIKRIENRAKQEVFSKLIEILKNTQFPEYEEDELIDYLRSEGYDPKK